MAAEETTPTRRRERGDARLGEQRINPNSKGKHRPIKKTFSTIPIARKKERCL